MNGVEKPHKNKKTTYLHNTRKKQPNHIKDDVEVKKCGRRATQESVDNRQDGEEGNYHGD
ncbi:hypothetical protein I6E35_10380 [Blautia producta]|nr:hypothetical protein [Blautia producta]